MKSLQRVVLAALAAFLSGCSGEHSLNTPTPSPSASAVPAANTTFDGKWTGVTSEGLEMSISVSGGQVKSFYVEMNTIQGNTCTFPLESVDGSGNFDLASPPAPFVHNDRFTINTRAPAPNSNDPDHWGTVSLVIDGTFTGTSVTGSARSDFISDFAHNPYAMCYAHTDLTWQLTRP